MKVSNLDTKSKCHDVRSICSGLCLAARSFPAAAPAGVQPAFQATNLALEAIVFPTQIHVDTLKVSRFGLKVVAFFRAISIHTIDAAQFFARLFVVAFGFSQFAIKISDGRRKFANVFP